MSNGSKHQQPMTSGLDLGDGYSYVCLIDAENVEVVELGKRRIKGSPFP